ncbi:MAG TPA: DUF3267 domain-containing protein [Bacteroidales bacterium]|nr:DUF3267 domain-containing protein [Bacteroidales bacterium]
MKTLEGYKEEELTIDLVKANIYGLLILIPIAVIYGLPYFLIWGDEIGVHNAGSWEPSLIAGSRTGSILIFISLVLGIILHELIHGITWYFFTEDGFKSIKFGILKQMATPYCHCKEPLQVHAYLLGAVMPAIILGLIPAIIAMIIGNLGLLILAAFFTMAAIGDLMIINLLRKEKGVSFVLDHPSEAGCFVYRKIEEE